MALALCSEFSSKSRGPPDRDPRYSPRCIIVTDARSGHTPARQSNHLPVPSFPRQSSSDTSPTLNLGTVIASPTEAGDHINHWPASPGLRPADLIVGENCRVPETYLRRLTLALRKGRQMNEAPEDLRHRLDQLRLLAMETTDPLAERLVRDMIIELENRLTADLSQPKPAAAD